MLRPTFIALAAGLALAAAACGGGESEQPAASRATTSSTKAATTASTGGDTDFSAVEAALDRMDKEVPTADKKTEPLMSIRVPTARTMDEFLTAIIQDVDRYWTRTLTAAGLREPNVMYNWLEPGTHVQTGCTEPDGSFVITDDTTAAYCGPDDTIYLSQQFALDFWNGLLGGQSAGFRPGDFGVAYVVAHEYAHNIQTELGISARSDVTVPGLEQQADCLAGTWANSAYYEGVLESGDVEEAIASAALVGDFNFSSPTHHGTPEERVAAWRLGYDTGNPAECNRYTPSG